MFADNLLSKLIEVYDGHKPMRLCVERASLLTVNAMEMLNSPLNHDKYCEAGDG